MRSSSEPDLASRDHVLVTHRGACDRLERARRALSHPLKARHVLCASNDSSEEEGSLNILKIMLPQTRVRPMTISAIPKAVILTSLKTLFRMRAFAAVFCALIVSTTVQASAIEIPIGTKASLAIHDISCLCLYRWPTFSRFAVPVIPFSLSNSPRWVFSGGRPGTINLGDATDLGSWPMRPSASPTDRPVLWRCAPDAPLQLAERAPTDTFGFGRSTYARTGNPRPRAVLGQLQRRPHEGHECAPGTATKQWIAHLNAKLNSVLKKRRLVELGLKAKGK